MVAIKLFRCSPSEAIKFVSQLVPLRFCLNNQPLGSSSLSCQPSASMDCLIISTASLSTSSLNKNWYACFIFAICSPFGATK